MKLLITYLRVLAVISCLTYLGSCESVPYLPGPNDMFYCKVNGKHWKNDNNGDFKLNTFYGEVTDGGQSLFIRVTNAKLDQTMNFIIKDTSGIKLKEYELSVNTYYPDSPPMGYFFNGQKKYATSQVNKGIFRIISFERQSSDLIKLIAEFNFKATDTAGEPVHITDGKVNNHLYLYSK